MASKEEFKKMLSEYIGDDTGDSAIKLMETITDSWDDSRTVELENKVALLEQEKTELDKTWREKYMKRFTDATPTTSDDEKEEVDDGANDSEVEDLEPPTFEEIAKEF